MVAEAETFYSSDRVLEDVGSLGRPSPTSWIDDLLRFVGIRCMQAAQDRSLWRGLEEVYVQQWTSVALKIEDR